MVIEGTYNSRLRQVSGKENVSVSEKSSSAEHSGKSGFKDTSVIAQVSEKSKAAIKAYRIAIETKPRLSMPNRMASIKTQVANGLYFPSASAVAEAVLKSAA